MKHFPGTMRVGLFSLSFVFVIFLCSSLHARIWTNVDGREIEAEFVKVEGEFVYLQLASGSRKTVKVDVATLNEKDRIFISTRMKELVLEKFSDPEKYHTAKYGEDILSIPLTTDSRATYTLRPSFALLSVEDPNNEYTNVSYSGQAHISGYGESTDLDDLAKKEASLHGRNHDTTAIFDLPDGGVMLVYTTLKKGGKSITERRCFLWQPVGDSLVTLDFTNNVVSGNRGKGRVLSLITEMIEGLRVNGGVIPHADVLQEIFFGADPARFSKILEKKPENTGAFNLAMNGDTVIVPRQSGERYEQYPGESFHTFQALLEPKEPGVSERVSIDLSVRLIETGDVKGLIEKLKETSGRGYDTFYIKDLPDGAKILVLNREAYDSGDSIGRRAVLCRKLNGSVLQIRITQGSWSKNPYLDEDIRVLSALLQQIKANGQSVDGCDLLVSACFVDDSKLSVEFGITGSLK